MATDKLIVDIALKGIVNSTKQLDAMAQKVEQLGIMSAQGLIKPKVAEMGVDRIKKSFKGLEKTIDNTFKSGQKSAARFDMRLLSLMFAGMALQRAFGGMLRGIVTTYMTAEDKSSGLYQATNRLHAAWEFLKFSIFEALNADWFITIIDWMVKWINWVAQLDDKWKITGLGMIGGLALIGAGLMAIGQVALGWGAIFGTSGFLTSSGGIIGSYGGTAASAKGLAGIGGLLSKLATIAAIAIAIKFAYDSVTADTWYEAIKKATYAAGIVGLIAVAYGAGLPLALTISAAVLIGLTAEYFWSKKKMKAKWEEITGKIKEPGMYGYGADPYAGGIKPLEGIAGGLTVVEDTKPLGELDSILNSLQGKLKTGVPIAVSTTTESFTGLGEKVGLTPAIDDNISKIDTLTTKTIPVAIDAFSSENGAIDDNTEAWRRNTAAIQENSTARGTTWSEAMEKFMGEAEEYTTSV